MLPESVVSLMQAGSLTMTFFAAILILVVTRNVKDTRAKTKVALAMIGVALLLFAIPLFGEVLGSPIFERYGSLARIVAAIFLPYGLYRLAPRGESVMEHRTR